jgi:hypothetical protein
LDVQWVLLHALDEQWVLLHALDEQWVLLRALDEQWVLLCALDEQWVLLHWMYSFSSKQRVRGYLPVEFTTAVRYSFHPTHLTTDGRCGGECGNQYSSSIVKTKQAK